MENKSPKFPNKYLFIGAAFFVMGAILLMWTQGLLPGFTLLWPVPLIVAGMLCLYFTYLKGKADVLIVPGLFFFLGGILILLMNTILPPRSLGKIWPIFMLFIGISLLPFGFKKVERYRVAILTPAIVIIILALTFLPFSLGITPFSFAEFVTRWWPVILIILGIFFIISHVYKWKKNNHTDSKQ